MTDLHERFRDWLLAGAPGEPARDAALHASGCDRCLADLGALDALLAVDVAGADVPFLPAGAARPIRAPGVRALRALSGVTAVGLLVLAAMIGAGALRDNTGGPGVAVNPTESPDGEGILAGGPTSTPAPSGDPGSPIASAAESAGASDAPEASEVAASAMPTTPPFVAPPPPPVTPGPTTAVTPAPTTAATPAPTPAPTAPPTATPAPSVTATPVPPTPTPTPVPPTPAPTLPPPSELPTPPPSEAPPP
jgi:outer membrane biosynthesis protein TonB